MDSSQSKQLINLWGDLWWLFYREDVSCVDRRTNKLGAFVDGSQANFEEECRLSRERRESDWHLQLVALSSVLLLGFFSLSLLISVFFFQTRPKNT